MNRVFSTKSSLMFLVVVAGLMAFAFTGRAQNAATSEPAKTAEQQFKNIQVLKGAPADQVIPAMQFISYSLGVECGFCHVQGAFEKDDKKPKQVARKMMEMQMAINHDNFKGQTEVTCFSCHRGAENPVGVPIISAEAKRPEEEQAEGAEAQLPSAEAILDKYLQAVGGAAAVEKITSRVEKGTVDIGGHQSPIEVLSKAPNKRISIVQTPNGNNITAFDGRSGWLGSPGPRPPRDMSAQENEASSFDATFHRPVELKKMFAQFRVRPADKIDGHEVVQVIGLNEGKQPVRLFFDKESGLLVRTVRYAETPLGRNPTEVDYADYRAEGGVKIPFQWTVARPASRFTIQVSEVQQNVQIDDAKFTKPAASQQPPAK